MRSFKTSLLAPAIVFATIHAYGGSPVKDNSSAAPPQDWSKTVQTVSVVVGVIITVLSYNLARQKEAGARVAEAENRRAEAQRYEEHRHDELQKQVLEASRPFVELRQRLYGEAIRIASVLATPDQHDVAEVEAARKRFWELYWGELTFIESPEVETAMCHLGDLIEPNHPVSPQQGATYKLATALRASLKRSLRVVDDL